MIITNDIRHRIVLCLADITLHLTSHTWRWVDIDRLNYWSIQLNCESRFQNYALIFLDFSIILESGKLNSTLKYSLWKGKGKCLERFAVNGRWVFVLQLRKESFHALAGWCRRSPKPFSILSLNQQTIQPINQPKITNSTRTSLLLLCTKRNPLYNQWKISKFICWWFLCNSKTSYFLFSIAQKITPVKSPG